MTRMTFYYVIYKLNANIMFPNLIKNDCQKF